MPKLIERKAKALAVEVRNNPVLQDTRTRLVRQKMEYGRGQQKKIDEAIAKLAGNPAITFFGNLKYEVLDKYAVFAHNVERVPKEMAEKIQKDYHLLSRLESIKLELNEFFHLRNEFRKQKSQGTIDQEDYAEAMLPIKLQFKNKFDEFNVKFMALLQRVSPEEYERLLKSIKMPVEQKRTLVLMASNEANGIPTPVSLKPVRLEAVAGERAGTGKINLSRDSEGVLPSILDVEELSLSEGEKEESSSRLVPVKEPFQEGSDPLLGEIPKSDPVLNAYKESRIPAEKRGKESEPIVPSIDVDEIFIGSAKTTGLEGFLDNLAREYEIKRKLQEQRKLPAGQRIFDETAMSFLIRTFGAIPSVYTVRAFKFYSNVVECHSLKRNPSKIKAPLSMERVEAAHSLIRNLLSKRTEINEQIRQGEEKKAMHSYPASIQEINKSISSHVSFIARDQKKGSRTEPGFLRAYLTFLLLMDPKIKVSGILVKQLRNLQISGKEIRDFLEKKGKKT